MLRPPSNPRPLAPLPEHRTTGGAAPGPPRQCAHGAAAHRCGRRRPHPGGAGRLRPGPGSPPAPRRRERAHEAGSGVGGLSPDLPASPSRTAPPTDASPASWTRRGRGRKPSRRDSSRRRRRLGATLDAARGAAKAARCRAVHPEDGGGSLPAPFSRQNGRTAAKRMGRRPTGTRAFGNRGVCGKRQKQRQEVGVVLLPQHADPESCATGEQRRARPGSHPHRATLDGGAPPPGPTTGGDRRGRSAHPRHGGGRPDGGETGSGLKVRYVPFAAPSGAARGPRSRRPVRSEVLEVPAVALSDSGLPGR